MFSGVKGHKIIIIISSLLFERSISFAFLSCSFNFLKKKNLVHLRHVLSC